MTWYIHIRNVNKKGYQQACHRQWCVDGRASCPPLPSSAPTASSAGQCGFQPCPSLSALLPTAWRAPAPLRSVAALGVLYCTALETLPKGCLTHAALLAAGACSECAAVALHCLVSPVNKNKYKNQLK